MPPNATSNSSVRFHARIAVGLVLFTLSSCAARGPVVGAGAGDRTPERTGTISGVVRAAGSNAPLSARKVTATEVTTGAKIEASSAANGGYTMKVRVGKYRLDVELRAGESLVEGPSELEISSSDLDAARNFVISVPPPV